MGYNFYDGSGTSPWINWYMPQPVQPISPVDPDPDPDPTPILPVVSDPNPFNIRGERGRDDPSDSNDPIRATRNIMAKTLGGGIKNDVSFIGIDQINFNSFDEYLTAKGIPDRNGVFSGVSLEGTEFADTRVVEGPLGKSNRNIPKHGFFGFMASVSLGQEFDALGKIKQAHANNPNPLDPFENGMAFTVGDTVIYAEPGSNIYKNVDKVGINQQTAQGLADLALGRLIGEDIRTDLASGNLVTTDSLNEIGTDRLDNYANKAILSTENGGWALDGSFNFKGRKTSAGRMIDNDQLAEKVFNGNTSVARSWCESSSSKPTASAIERIADLQYFMDVSQGVSALDASSKRTNTIIARIKAGGSFSPDITKPKVTTTTPGGTATQQTQDPEKGSGDSAPSGSDFGAEDRTSPDRYGGREAGGPSGGGYGGYNPDRRGRAMGGRAGYNLGGVKDDDMIISEEEARNGTDESGFIVRPSSEVSDEKSIADDYSFEAEDEDFIINKSAVDIAGQMDIARMIEDAENYLRQTGRGNPEGDEKQGKTSKINVSAGEVRVRKELAEVIGYDVLRKINNRGRPATEKKIQDSEQQGFLQRPVGAAGGGLLSGKKFADGDVVTSLSPREEALRMADQELRNDLDTYLRGSPIHQLGYELVRRGDYQIRAGFPPKDLADNEAMTSLGFMAAPAPEGESLTNLVSKDMLTDRPVDESKGYAFYFAGPDKKIARTGDPISTSTLPFTYAPEEPRTDTDMRILAHELGHVGIAFIQKYFKDRPKYGYRTEEYVMRLGDEVIRERNNLPHTRVSLTDPLRNAESMFASGLPANYYTKKGSPRYKKIEKMFLNSSKEAQKILKEEFGFIEEVKKPEKTYLQKFKEFFTK